MEVKKVVLQATGLLPFVVEKNKKFISSDALGKRTVSLSLILATDDYWWYQLSLFSKISTERANQMVGGPYENNDDCFELMLEAIRYDAKNILPIGSGFSPAPENEGKQIELKLQLESVVADILTKTLKIMHQESWIKHVSTFLPFVRISFRPLDDIPEHRPHTRCRSLHPLQV